MKYVLTLSTVGPDGAAKYQASRSDESDLELPDYLIQLGKTLKRATLPVLFVDEQWDRNSPMTWHAVNLGDVNVVTVKAVE